MTTILSFLFLSGSFLNFKDPAGTLIKVTLTQITGETLTAKNELPEKTFLLSLFIILIPVLSVITIFLFKKRRLQMLLVKFLIVLIIVLIIVSGSYSYIIMTKYNSEIIPGFRMVIPLLQLIFSVIACRGIRKDDDLVKSYDRLR